MGYVPGPSLKDILIKLQTTPSVDPLRLKAASIRELLLAPSVEQNDISQRSISLKRELKFWDKTYLQFVLTIAAEIASALSYAHQNGIIHGDIKPSNILLTNEGIPLIADFGLSKDFKDFASPKDNEFTGTLVYAAPEQIKENITNEKTDIWAIGVTLYELTTFRNPFRESTIEKTAQKISKGNSVPLRGANKKIPPEVEAIVNKCLELKPENRYASIADLSDDLRNYLGSKPIKAKPVNIIGRTHKWSKRHPAGATFSIIFLLIILSFSYLSYCMKINKLITEAQDLQHAGHSQRSIKIYEEVLKSSTAFPPMTKMREQAFLGLAQMYDYEKKSEKALKYFEKCLDINPNNVDALNGIKFLYEDLGLYDEVIKTYERLLQLTSGVSIYFMSYPDLLQKLGKVDKASEVYKRLLERAPYDSNVIYEYSKFLRDIRHTEEAIKFLAQKCKFEGIGNDALIQLEIYNYLKDAIKMGSPFIDDFNKAEKFLISKGFDKEYANLFIENHKDMLRPFLPLPLTENIKIKELLKNHGSQAFEDAKKQLKENHQKWALLRKDMTKDQILELLGNPWLTVSEFNSRAMWIYSSGGQVWFDDKEKGGVLMWQEP